MKALRVILPSIILGLINSPVWADKGGLPALEARVSALEAALIDSNGTISQLQEDLTTANDQITQLHSDLSDLETLTACVSYDPQNGDLFFTGCNVHLRNGVGTTDSLNGFGNLIIGYDTDIMQTLDRSGSHNLILGDEQTYANSGQLLSQFVGSNQNLLIQAGDDLNMASGVDMQIVAGNNLSESISNDRSTTVGKDSTLVIGGDRNTSVTNDVFVSIDGNLTEVVAQDLSVQAADQISLTTGSASMVMKPNGDIDIDGKDVSVTASGDINIKATANVIVKGATIQHN